jgi:hypothetical protein
VALYFNEKYEAVLPALYHLHRGLASLSTSSFSTPAFNALDRSGTNVEIHGKILHLRDIKSMVLSLIEEIEDGIEKLTLGLGFVTVPEHVTDRPRETKGGYSFIADPVNPFQEEADMVLKKALLDLTQFYVLDSNGRVIWMPGPCFEYLHLHNDILKKLFVATHLTSGSPARGTELSSQLIENVPGGSIRNVLFLYNIFLCMGTHNKTSHVGNEDKNMVRVPLQALVLAWLTMLVRVRPFVVTLQYDLRGQRAALNARRYLYPGVYHPLMTSDLSRALAKATDRLLSIRLTLKDWRHLMAWFTQDHAELFEQTHIQTTAVHIGFGHSGVVNSGEYASDMRLPDGLDNVGDTTPH